jgi:hypothetical protein
MDKTDWLWTALKWLAVIVVLSPIWGAIGWEVIAGVLLPRLIPRRDIERHADEIMRQYPEDPEQAAFINEHRAWRDSDSREQGKWKRVRREIGRRLRQKLDHSERNRS